MIPWALIDRATVPGGGELRLMQRDAEFSIMLGTIQLMSSRRAGSEEALATISCDRIRDHTQPHVLIGGLGMGFTLRAALTVLGADARIAVAELVPAVVAWARGPLAGIFKAALKDPRLDIYEGDVGRLIGSSRLTYDAILLDVDNGPEGLTRKANDRLYDLEGLRAARGALKRNGILAVWSSTPNKRFTGRLHASGFSGDQIKIHANASGGAQSVIWIATPFTAGKESVEGHQQPSAVAGHVTAQAGSRWLCERLRLAPSADIHGGHSPFRYPLARLDDIRAACALMGGRRSRGKIRGRAAREP